MKYIYYDHLDQKFFKIFFHNIIGYVCVPNNYFDEKKSEKNY